jgi:hypothetical protein
MGQQMMAFEIQGKAQRALKQFSATSGGINLEFIHTQKISASSVDINQFTTKIELRSPLSKMQKPADIDAIPLS